MPRPGLLLGAIAVLGGLVMIEALFLPWYRLERTIAGVPVASEWNAWQTMSAMDVLLLLVAIAAVAGGVASVWDGRAAVVALAAGALGVLLSLLGLVDLPEPALSAGPGDTVDVGREIGPFVALVASAGVAWAGWRATRARVPSAGRAARRAAPGRSPRARRPPPRPG